VIIYFIFAILFELVIGIGVPFVLLFQRYLTRYFNINFTSIKPIMDQLNGCYKEEYHWFAAYYLLCRQLIYAVDIVTDFMTNTKFPVLLTTYLVIMMIHVLLQPYKEKTLNALDTCILVLFMLVFIGEHATDGSTIVLWCLPLILVINCVAFSTKVKYLSVPISCLILITFSLCLLLYYIRLRNKTDLSDVSFLWFTVVLIILISSLVLLAYIIYICAAFKRCCKHQSQAQHRLISINEQNEDSYEDNDSNTANS